MIGIDLVHIPTFTEQLHLGGERFFAKTFHESEVRNHDPEHLAGLWAAKEAVFKAGGVKLGEWLNVVISHDKQGRPSARVGRKVYDISIAHHGEYAVAVAQI